jgi:hypothetical protein
VSFTLMPGGSVVAVPADRVESLAPIDPAATVSTTAPLGWQ